MPYEPGQDIPKYDFTKDLAYGEQGEATVKTFLEALSAGSFEVKQDRHRNGRMVVETQQNPRGKGWKDSGINVTQATWWVYIFSPAAFVVVEVARLKKYLKRNHWEESDKKIFAPNSDNPTKGFLLMDYHVKELLSDTEYD